MEHRTGIEMYCTIDEKNKRLRYGYTTGSCAAAAAQAATRMLLTGDPVEEVALETPKGILLHLLIEEIRQEREEVSCAVRKDGGDDPDVTHGILVFARVRKTQSRGVVIDGGIGVGRVTKPGLQQPVGEAAINETPRRMIQENVEKVCGEYGYEGGISVTIEIPEGVEIGKKTFNPRLGILGGISVLGTSGIVIPMSEAALVESIRLEMKMLVNNGAEYLVITPGNYGQVFSESQLDLDLTYSMKCSNYVGETLDMARELGIKGILFIAHIGKFTKVAGGIMNTHSRNADSRAELMAANALRAGAGKETVLEILESVTTEQSVDILIRDGMLEATMARITEKVDYYLNKRAGEQMKVAAILFSSVHGELGRTSLTGELCEHFKENIMQGKLYGLGVGPGDPELLTLKALRLIKENEVVAVPGNDIKASVAYQIVKGVYEELDEKILIPVAMPMTKDKAVLEANHQKAADDVERYLKEGKNVVFLTLGDPTVYSTYLYVHKRILDRGYEAEIVSGITSFCAVAARLNMGLVEMAEPLHVIPATYKAEEMDEILKLPGTKVLMKTGRKMKEVRESILRSGQRAVMIENCGMPEEKIYETAETIPENAGYYSLIIVKEK